MQLEVAIDPEIASAQATWKRLANNQRAAYIRAALKLRGLQQTELQELLGIKWQTMSTWTNGHAAVDWSRWMSICLALNIPQTWKPKDLPAPLPNKKRVRKEKAEVAVAPVAPPAKKKARA